MNIEKVVNNGESEYIEFKSNWSESVIKTIVAFANTEGGTIIIGYSANNNRYLGVRQKDVYIIQQELNPFKKICKINVEHIEDKEILVIKVLKSDELLYYKGKAWYRNGTMDLQYSAIMINNVYATIFNSVKGLSLSELSRETNVGKEFVGKILEVGDIPIKKLKRGRENYYYRINESTDEVGLETDLKNVKNASELIKYLEYKAKKITKGSMLHQYTTIKAALSIIEKREFYIGSPINMNDKSEYNNYISKNGSDSWEDTFFTCFMNEDNESIAMWSQYAMPWEKGVRLSIPAEIVRQWIKSIEILHVADVSNKKKIVGKQIENSKFRKSFYLVAYTNEDDIKEFEKKEIVKVGEAVNDNMSNLYDDKNLRGYVKNIAWGYEKEVRFRIEIPCNNEIDEKDKIKGIIIDIPDFVLGCIEVMKGPRVDEDDEDWNKLLKLTKEKKLKEAKRSIFDGKLQNMACDRCEKLKKGNEV